MTINNPNRQQFLDEIKAKRNAIEEEAFGKISEAENKFYKKNQDLIQAMNNNKDTLDKNGFYRSKSDWKTSATQEINPLTGKLYLDNNETTGTPYIYTPFKFFESSTLIDLHKKLGEMEFKNKSTQADSGLTSTDYNSFLNLTTNLIDNYSKDPVLNVRSITNITVLNKAVENLKLQNVMEEFINTPIQREKNPYDHNNHFSHSQIFNNKPEKEPYMFKNNQIIRDSIDTYIKK